jgi:hypothetical protein
MKTQDTSRAAAATIDLSACRRKVYQHIFRRKKGATCDAIEARTGMLHQTVSARVCELRQDKRIRDSGRREKTRSGRRAIVWVVA